MRAKSKTEVAGAATRRRRSLVASAFTSVLMTAGVFGFFGPAEAATTNQLLPPKPSLCPRGTALITTGTYRGLCTTVQGVIFNPITRKILYSPPPRVPAIKPPSLPSTQPPVGSQPTAPGPGTPAAPSAGGRPASSSGRPHLISSSIISSHSYGTPYGVYFGNFGGGKTYFSPTGLTRFDPYRKVYYLSAFGRPLDSDVSTAVIDATRVSPVSTRVPHAPDEVWLLLPVGLVLLTMVTYLVLEPDADRVLV
ncbi:MAG: hypothetical protein M3N24_02485 [Actinomycetota bacterium]|nr:hypothetical protein [Actinomycetota bacterium]